MNNLYVIGTIHGENTNKLELIQHITKVQPETILVEIDEEEIQKQGDLTKYPPEMQFALNYA